MVTSACASARRAAAASAYGAAWAGFVDPLSYTYYKAQIGAGGALMALLEGDEATLAAFEAAGATAADRAAAAEAAVAAYDADSANWGAKTSRDAETLAAYATEIVALGTEMDAKFAIIQDDVAAVLASLETSLEALRTQLKEAKDEADAEEATSIFSEIFSVVGAVVNIGACFAEGEATGGAALLACGPDVVESVTNVVDSTKDTIDTFESGCEPCKSIEAEQRLVASAAEDLDRFADLVAAARSLESCLTAGAPLPSLLPSLVADELDLDSLRASADALADELERLAGDSGDDLAADVRDWIDLGVTRVSLFLTYYSLASRQLDDEGSLAALATRTDIVRARLAAADDAEAAAATAARLVVERQRAQASLVLQYLFEEWKQFNYLSLGKAPALDVPENPTSTDILTLQVALDAAIEAEIREQAGAGSTWIYIEVSAAAEPSTFAALRGDASAANVSLPIPLVNATDANGTRVLEAGTTYYEMRMTDVSVYLLDENSTVIGGSNGQAQIDLTKAGESSFFDAEGSLSVFTHKPVEYGSGFFAYDAAKQCPITGDTCGDALCPDYVRYSPYGKWSVGVPRPDLQGIDMAAVDKLRFEFHVTYKRDGFTLTYFGKDPALYPQGLGSVCDDT